MKLWELKMLKNLINKKIIVVIGFYIVECFDDSSLDVLCLLK